MHEVLACEAAISGFLKTGTDAEASAIMRGLPKSGTRLDALKRICKRLNLAVDT